MSLALENEQCGLKFIDEVSESDPVSEIYVSRAVHIIMMMPRMYVA